MFEKNTPRDFFLHAGAFITLYLSTIALITLLFDVINYSFPDPMYGAYNDPYSGPMRFAIASLVVLTPISVYLFFLIQKAARENPERKGLGVRKWLTYITLFIAGATIVGDLIVLLNSFLGGTLPQAFLLKVLVILGVMGAAFGYFFLDIKGYWMKNVEYSRYVGVGVVAVVLVAIVGGMTLMGSPTTQRSLRVDSQQINDLGQIQSVVVEYWRINKALPVKLTDVENTMGFMVPRSPENQPAYEYKATGELSFQLCATFLEESLPQKYTYVEQSGLTNSAEWNHTAGEVCFSRAIDPKLIPPYQNQLEIPLPAPVKQ